MISIWHVLIFLIFNTLTLFAAFYSGFYFGWMSRKETPPARMPLVSTFAEILEKPEKKTREEIEELERENTFMA